MAPQSRATTTADLDQFCPRCDEPSVVTYRHEHAFNYGSGETAVKLHVELPVRRCTACDFQFLDHEAERIKHYAVCRHLGVLTPGEVRRIREGHGLTRAAFAQLTGLGEATLNRWENGTVIQNPANDRYLRLLGTPTGWSRLARLVGPDASQETSSSTSRADTPGQFRKLEPTATVRQQQGHFDLEPAA